MDYCDIEWFALETNRDHSVIFEIASKYCILDSFVEQDGYSISFPKKGNAIECSSYHTIALISHANKVMLNILQARLQQYGNRDVQAGFRKARGMRDQIANTHCILEKAREFKKKNLLLLH